jgi:Na+-transporting NADH:ubiquinone oxidoreductase subunit NqrD
MLNPFKMLIQQVRRTPFFRSKKWLSFFVGLLVASWVIKHFRDHSVSALDVWITAVLDLLIWACILIVLLFYFASPTHEHSDKGSDPEEH